MKTSVTKKINIEPKWHLIDASTKSLGRIATEVAGLLMGKHKPTYTPTMVSGDKVVIINSDKLKLTGSKLQDKTYYRHSQYADGAKQRNAEYYMDKDSTFVVINAVSGMLPKNKLRDQFLKNLYVYKDENHKHTAQVKDS